MKKSFALLLSSALLLTSVVPASAGSTMPAMYSAPSTAIFSDVNRSNINAEAVSYLRDKKVVEGYSDGSFGVDKAINRAEFLKILLLSTDGYTENAGSSCLANAPAAVKKLSDLDLTAWYAPYMCYAVQKGIMQGYPDGLMRPANTINVPEMAKIVAFTMQLPLGSEGTNWYEKFVLALEAKNALPESLSELSHMVTRGEMAETIFRTKENRTDKASTTLTSLLKMPVAHLTSGNVGKIASCSELSSVMDRQMREEGTNYLRYQTMNEEVSAGAPNMNFNGSVTSDAAASPEKTGAGGGTDTDFSTTNVQVEGVDEADIVKNDARYIYTIRGNEVRIVDTKDASGSMKEIARIKAVDENFSPTDMYLDGNRLIVLGSTYGDIPAEETTMSTMRGIMPPYYYYRDYTKNIILDVTDHAAPKIERTVRFDGYLSQSRRIGNKLYLVLNDEPRYWLMREQFLPVDAILPKFADSARGDIEKNVVGCDQVQYFPGFQRPNYMTVAVVPTDDTTKNVSAQVFLGDAEQIHMSPESLYVTTGAYDGTSGYWNWDFTQIYKFALSDTGVEQKGTARVRGRVLNQFSMDEYQNHFRIATTNNNWTDGSNNSENAVYVLDEAMKIVGSVLDIAPGETIYSARFMGDRAYLVTFKQVDPFFVLDLKVPNAPKILGALKIPGWSNYLHPYDANHVIGIGRDVPEDTSSTDGRTTWQNVQGLKMSMFDVTDPANPVEQFKTTLGVSGTYSDIFYNHKALLFDKEKNLLAFPISISEPDGVRIYKECTLDATGAEVCTETNRYDATKTTFEGAVIFTVDLVNGFTERGRISHFAKGFLDWSASNIPDDEYLKTIMRVIYIGDKLYTISQAMIKQATLDTVQETGVVNLAK